MKSVAQRLNEFRLSKARNSFEKDMAFAENGHQDVVDQIRVTDNDFGNFLMHAAEIRFE
jgi:hypothetical protein